VTRGELHESLRLGDQAIAAARALGRPDLELRFADHLVGRAARRASRRRGGAAARAARALRPRQRRLRAAVGVLAASALALDYANRLGDAMAAWESARAVAQRAKRRDMLWKTMANSASTQAKMGLVEQAAQLAEQAHQIACASNEDRQHARAADAGHARPSRCATSVRYGRALELLDEALAGYAASGASHSDFALAEQRLVVLYQHLGQPARALPPARARSPRRAARRGDDPARAPRRARGADGTRRPGADARGAADHPNADDIFHRIVTLFATRLVPADEGEALAANLALWATTRERHGVALSATCAAAACALALGAPARALPHVEAARRLATRYLPDSFYLPELWLVSAQAFATLAASRPRAAPRPTARPGSERSTTATCRRVPRQLPASQRGQPPAARAAARVKRPRPTARSQPPAASSRSSTFGFSRQRSTHSCATSPG
jgi:hypothetical protein